MKSIWKIQIAIGLLLLLQACSGCRGGYSFTGSSLSPEIKTVSVEYFQNMAPIVIPTLSNTFTEALTNKIRRQTKLEFVTVGGDLAFEGEITDYNVVSVNVQANEQATTNRLTISVKVRCTNLKDEKQSFNESFNAHADFDSNRSIDSVQDELITQIVETLTENILNKAVSNW